MKDITEYKRFCDVNANQEFWCDYIKYKKIGDYVAIELDTPKNIQSIHIKTLLNSYNYLKYIYLT